MTDLIGPISGLAGLLIGAGLTRGSSRDTWRRDQRTSVYADLLREAHDVTDTMRQAAELSELDYTGPISWGQMQDTMRPLRQAARTADLFAGPAVRAATLALLQATHPWVDSDPTDVDLLAFANATEELAEAMRHELDPARRALPWRR